MDIQNKLIVFDWNGTLLSDTAASLRATNDCLKIYDHPPITLKHSREVFNFPIIHFYHKLGLSTDQILEKQDEANEAFATAYAKHAKNTRTRRGARRLLQGLNKQGATCIILSNANIDNIKSHLKRLDLEPYFTHISAHTCDGTTVLHKTTKHERLEHYMREHGHTPENTIIIGDSPEEPALAKALGLTSIGITGGCITTTRLHQTKPDHIVHSLDKIQEIIMKKFIDK